MLKKLIQSSNHWQALALNGAEDCFEKSVQIPAFGHLDPLHA
jgi:hypothetical protein